jgi:hypothetical protein
MKKDFKQEVLLTVIEDLEYIMKEWNRDIEDEQLRRDCTIIRRLLIEDNLGRAWRAVGFNKQPRIYCPILDTSCGVEDIFFAQAGGAHYQGMQMQVEMGYGEIPKEIEKNTKKMVNKPLFLSEFLTSTCVIVNGTEISRHDLILYIANTLGGTHLEWNRGFEKQPSMKKNFERLDNHFKTGISANKESIYYELLSIGQNLANSSDTQKLVKKLKTFINQA